MLTSHKSELQVRVFCLQFETLYKRAGFAIWIFQNGIFANELCFSIVSFLQKSIIRNERGCAKKYVKKRFMKHNKRKPSSLV